LTIEVWLRVSGEREFLEAFETSLKREKGVSYQVVSRTRRSMVVRVLVPRLERCLGCEWCPLTSAPLGSMVKSIIFTPDFTLLEVLAAKPQALRELEHRGCHVVYTSETEEADYALTERQEEALVTAFLEGYYSYPRRVAAKELAAELGVSGSALAELLRKAEHRVIAKYVLEELPHLLVQALMRGRRVLVEEEAGGPRGGEGSSRGAGLVHRAVDAPGYLRVPASLWRFSLSGLGSPFSRASTTLSVSMGDPITPMSMLVRRYLAFLRSPPV